MPCRSTLVRNLELSYQKYLQVRGQLQNKTWSNIGVTWKPNTADENNNPHGGLTVNEFYFKSRKKTPFK